MDSLLLLGMAAVILTKFSINYLDVQAVEAVMEGSVETAGLITVIS